MGVTASNYTAGRNQREAGRVSTVTVFPVARWHITSPISHGWSIPDYAVGPASGQRQLSVAARRLVPRAPHGVRRSGARCQLRAGARPDPFLEITQTPPRRWTVVPRPANA